jgi:Flp pilus assembly protein TadG
MSTTEPAEPEPLTRVCRKCSTQSQTSGEFCPHCGARYSKPQRSRKRRTLIFGVPLLVVLVAAAVAATIVIHHNNQVAAHKRAVAAAARKVAAHRATVLAAQQAAQLAAQQAAQSAARAQAKLKRDLAKIQRQSLVFQLQNAVKKDALKDVTNGLLNGPITKVDCQPVTAADQTAPIANYSCLAVSSTAADGTESGYRFSSTLDVNSGSMTWRLGG